MRFTTSDFDVLVNHDQDGFRLSGLDARIESDAGAKKEIVWCVGDSTTWGFGVADADAYVSLLNKMSNGDTIFRNLGVPGYSSLQEYLLLEDRFERGEKPDEVLVLFATNDPQDNIDNSGTRPHIEVVNGIAYRRAQRNSSQANWRLRVWLKQNSLAYNDLSYYLARAKNVLREARKDGAKGVVKENASSQSTSSTRTRSSLSRPSDEYIALRAAYRMIAELCEKHGVRLTIAMPVREAMVEDVCGDLRIPLVDVSSYLARIIHEGPESPPRTV